MKSHLEKRRLAWPSTFVAVIHRKDSIIVLRSVFVEKEEEVD